MDLEVLNYRVIVEKEKQKGKVVYVAYAPTLGISDFGKTIEIAVKNIKKAIKLYLETLLDLKKPIPQPDSEEYFVTTLGLLCTHPSLQALYGKGYTAILSGREGASLLFRLALANSRLISGDPYFEEPSLKAELESNDSGVGI